MNIKISSDSTCDLSPELVVKNNIEILPLYIVKDGENFKDGIEITVSDIFEYTGTTGKLCSTAALNVQDYDNLFSRLLKDHDGIVHFTISSEMSSCYQNACIAAQEYENVYVVDSRNLSTGIGHLVLDACELAREGLTAKEIFERIEEKKAKLDVTFVVDTLEYLHKGGRCSSVAALGANLLKLKPCIEVKYGKMGVGKKYRGNLEKCIVQYIKDTLSDPDTIDSKRIFITASSAPDSIRAAAEQAVNECMHFDEILHTTAGSTVSCHCGPNTLGILFYRK